MATIFFGIDSEDLSIRQELNLSDEAVFRIMAYLMASSHGKVTENVQSTIPDASWSPGEDETEENRPTVAIQQWVTRDATPEEAMQSYAKSIINSLTEQTVAWEKQKAAEQATNSIVPLN